MKYDLMSEMIMICVLIYFTVDNKFNTQFSSI